MRYNIIILFLLFFCFPISGALNSAYLAICIAIGDILIYNKTSRLFFLFKITYIKNLLFATCLITVLAALWTLIIGAKDFSLTAAFFSVLIGIISLTIVLASLHINNLEIDTIEEICVNVFVLQSLISIAAFILPTFREIVHHFQFSNEAEQAEMAYSGFRGLAISGRLYFEFAATCGLIVFVQFKRIVNMKSPNYFEFVKLFLLIICGFFAGRTSLIGIGFGLTYLLFSHKEIADKFAFIWRLIIMIMALIVSAVLLLPGTIIEFVTEHFLPWVFDLFIKYFETGSTESSHSFTMLNEMYKNVTITSDEWIYGSGYFMSPNGIGYYKSVDGGYIRHLLYWGIIGSIINIWYGLIYFFKPIKLSANYNNRLYIFLALVYTFFVHYKGDLASTSRFYHVILICLLLPYVLVNKPYYFKYYKCGRNRYCPAVGR